MKSTEERFAILQDALSFLCNIEVTKVRPTVCAPYGDDLSSFGFVRVEWAPFVWIGDNQIPKDHSLFTNNKIFAIGLASVLTCLQLNLQARDKVLDMCAAPGIKSLYLQLLYDKKLDLYVNDISHARLIRLRTLFDAFHMPTPTFTLQTGQSLGAKYKPHYFDALIIDAPCSGEGNILKGDEEALKTWSQAKVKRLAELQRKLIKTGLQLVKEEGQMLYATCTLNAYENESALRKAGRGVDSSRTMVIENVRLSPNTSIRLVPSEQSIGFFVAKVK